MGKWLGTSEGRSVSVGKLLGVSLGISDGGLEGSSLGSVEGKVEGTVLGVHDDDDELLMTAAFMTICCEGKLDGGEDSVGKSDG